jgi:hypothetical protein
MWNIALLDREHKRGLADHKAAEQESMAIAGQEARLHVARYSQFKRRSASSLKDDTKSHIVRTKRGALLRLNWTKKYAAYLEYGTGSYRTTGFYAIRPRRAKALRFVIRGQVIFARKVMHPGVRAYKFGWKATSAAHRVMGERLAIGMARVSRRF